MEKSNKISNVYSQKMKNPKETTDSLNSELVKTKKCTSE